MVSRRYYPPWFSIAPMMDCTDNHYRTLARLMTKHAWLYTEMLAAETIVYQKDNLDRFLEFSPDQHPIVLQIGGNNLDNLAEATRLSNAYGYDEINFNCGCPSAKVAGHGCFGVRLMLDPKFVGECMSVIAANTDVPVSVKCRIGVDDHDSYNELCDFIYKVSSLSPTRHFIIHSRKALLNGISPAENRSIPPLKYEYFYGLLRDFPDLRFTINGGINCVDEVNAARSLGAHGVMVGRAAYNNPWQTLGHVDSEIFGAPSNGLTRRQILKHYEAYGDSVIGKYGQKPNIRDVIKPLLHFFYTEPGNGLWKRKADAAFIKRVTVRSFSPLFLQNSLSQYVQNLWILNPRDEMYLRAEGWARSFQTVKSFFEETLDAIPDYVLDSPVGGSKPLTGRADLFSNVHNLLPPPYDEARDKVVLEA